MDNKTLFKVCLLFNFLFAFGSNYVVAQTFEKIIRTEQDDYCFDAIETENHIIFAKITGNYFQDNSSSIIVLGLDGTIEQSLQLPDHDGYLEEGVKYLLKENDSLFYCLQHVRDLSNDDLQINLSAVSFNESSLSLLFDTIYGSTEISESIYDFKYTSDHKIIGSGRNDPLGQNALVIVIGLDDLSFDYRLYSVPQALLSSTIIDIPERNKYHVFMYLDNNKSFLEIDKLTMEIDTLYHYPERFWPRNAIKGISDSSYFAVGMMGQPYPGVNEIASFIEIGKDGSIDNIYEYEIHPDTNSYYTTQSFDHKFGKIYYALTYNFTLTFDFPYHSERRWIFLNKLNDDGSIIWQRFYKGEVNYMPYKVIATNDGGAIIFSTKCDWNDTIPNQIDLHILKVDSTGWYEGLPVATNNFTLMKQILVYPNPVKDDLYFGLGLYSDVDLQIYNANGQCVLTKTLNNSQKINISDFPVGLFIYVLTGKTGFIERGKFIKE